MTAIDFSPLLGELIAPLFAILGGVAAYFARRGLRAIERWLDIQLTDRACATVLIALDRALAYGEQRVSASLLEGAVADVRSAKVAAAAQYLIDQTPGALKKLGMSEPEVQRLVAAELAKRIG
ncbi:hypothetical protein CCP2SC5_1860002 [Azospirillaceae bacterium]